MSDQKTPVENVFEAYKTAIVAAQAAKERGF